MMHQYLPAVEALMILWYVLPTPHSQLYPTLHSASTNATVPTQNNNNNNNNRLTAFVPGQPG